MLLTLPICNSANADVEIRQVVPASTTQRKGISLAAQQSPQVLLTVNALRAEAGKLLEAKPQPLAVIHYEGLLNTDPRRIAAEGALADMDKLAAISEAFAATGDKRYADKATEFVMAWVKAYSPDGNTINENKLEPIFLAFELLRDRLDSEQKSTLESWLRQIAAKQITLYAHRSPEAGQQELNNWDSKRYKIVGIIGWLLGEKAWVQYSLDGFKHYIARGLFPDGTSVDLKTRDALSYHVAGLRPLLVIALWAELKTPGEGRKLFDYEAPGGASLRKSVEYVVPYATGEKQREEWRKSTVALDHQRAAAGIAQYQPGKLYDPLSSLEMFQLATLLDAKFASVVQKLSTEKGSQHLWLQLLMSTASATKQ
jgi:hypothetical protein